MTGYRFSIVVTCFNQRSFIREAIESALVQGADEVIVVDDASKDGSTEILHEYRDRVRLCPLATNGGVARARNHGARLATGDYILYLDGDDILVPWALTVYRRMLERHHAVVISGEKLPFREFAPTAQLGQFAHGPVIFYKYDAPMQKDKPAGLCASTLVVERAALLAAGGWSPEIGVHGDIKELMMKLGYAGPLLLIQEPITALYRIHEKQSIHEVGKYLAKAHTLLANERAGRYPGGAARRGERYAALGAYVLFWSRKGIRAGLWKQPMRLVLAGLPMVAFAVAYRSRSLAQRHRQPEYLDLDLSRFAQETSAVSRSER